MVHMSKPEKKRGIQGTYLCRQTTVAKMAIKSHKQEPSHSEGQILGITIEQTSSILIKKHASALSQR